MSQKPWTDEEIGFLQDHSDWSGQRLADELGRTVRSIKGARHALKNGRLGANPTRAPWSEDEDSVIFDADPTMNSKDLAKLLPGRTASAVMQRRLALGVEVLAGPGERATDIAGRPLVAKSCSACGLLLAGSWFHSFKRNGDIAWSARCKKCAADNAKERDRNPDYWRKRLDQLQQITVDQAERAGQPYTEADYEILADQSLTDLQKALRLKRTFTAVKGARQRAGLTSKPEGLGDPERDVWVIDNPNAPAVAA